MPPQQQQKQQRQQAGASRELLDVPDVSSLERRLNVVQPEAAPAAQTAGGSGAKLTTAPAPRSAVLDRLQRFLPQMQAANTQLMHDMQARPAQAFDIENVDEEAPAGYIEMDLACGVLDLLDEGAVHAAERSMQGQGPDLLGAAATACSDSGSDSDSSDDSEEEDGVEEEAPAHSARQGAGTQPSGTGSSAPAAGRATGGQRPEAEQGGGQRQGQQAQQGRQQRGAKRGRRTLVEEL